MRLGEMLIARGLIGPEDLEKALEIQKERGEKIGKILVDLGFVAMRDVLAALSEQLGIPLVTVEGPPPVTPETEGLSARFLRQCRFIPVALRDSTLTIAMADPLDFETLSAVRGFTGLEVEAVLAAEQEILDAIDRYCGEPEKEGAEWQQYTWPDGIERPEHDKLLNDEGILVMSPSEATDSAGKLAPGK